MSNQEGVPRNGTFAERYDSVMVPVIFQPFPILFLGSKESLGEVLPQLPPLRRRGCDESERRRLLAVQHDMIVARGHAGKRLDVVGAVPTASGWGKDVTLQRNGTSPSATYNESDWTELAKDTFDGLGKVNGSVDPDPDPDPITRWADRLEKWCGGTRLVQQDANKLRNLITEHVLAGVDWDAALLRTWKKTGLSKNVFLPNAAGQAQLAPDNSFVLLATDEDFKNEVAAKIQGALLALIRFDHYKTWDYPKSERDYARYANFLDEQYNRAVTWITENYRDKDQADPVEALLGVLRAAGSRWLSPALSRGVQRWQRRGHHRVSATPARRALGLAPVGR